MHGRTNKKKQILPSHSSPFGSGSHSPFPVHIDELDPVSTSPGEQLKVTVLPSIGKSSSLNTFGTDLEYPQLDGSSGRPQLAITEIVMVPLTPNHDSRTNTFMLIHIII